MSTISQHIPQKVVDFANYSKNTLAPMALKNIFSLTLEVGIHSWFTGIKYEDLAVGVVLRKSFEAAGNQGLSLAQKRLTISPTNQAALKTANAGLAFYTSYFLTQSAGYQVPAGLAYIQAMAIGLNLYQIYLGDAIDEEKNSKVEQITKDNFEEKVKNSKLPTIVDVYATWCGPCKTIAPIFVKMAEEMDGKVNFVKIDIDQEPELAQKLDIQALPTFLFFKDGQEVHRMRGLIRKEHFSDLINKLEFVEKSEPQEETHSESKPVIQE